MSPWKWYRYDPHDGRQRPLPMDPDQAGWAWGAWGPQRGVFVWVFVEADGYHWSARSESVDWREQRDHGIGVQHGVRDTLVEAQEAAVAAGRALLAGRTIWDRIVGE